MPRDYNNHIESFSIDYRDNVKADNHKGVTRSVVGQNISMKKDRHMAKGNRIRGTVHASNLHNNYRESEESKYQVYINAKPRSFYRGFMVVMTIMLTAIGIGIFTSTLNKTSVMTAETVNYNNFNGFLYPVVMQDPVEFSSPENADKCMVISSSIWMTIFRNKADSYNNFDEQGYALIPVGEVKESCSALFGDDKLINFSETIHGPFFYYNPGEECMHVGAISNQGRPLPQIKEVKEEENRLVFTVEYVLMGSPEEDPNQREIIKTMVYDMHLNEKTDKYYIYAVKQAE